MGACSRAAPLSSPRRPRGRRRSGDARRTVSARASCSPARDSYRAPWLSRPAVEGRGWAPLPPGVRGPAGRPIVSAGLLRRYLRVPPGTDHAGRVYVDGPHVGARRRLDDILGEASSGISGALELDRDPDLAESVLSARYGVDAEVRQPSLYVRRGVDGAEDRVDGPLALGLGLERADLVCCDRLEVRGGYGLLVVRYLLETREGPFEHIALDVVAELLEGVLEGVAARVLAEENVRPFEADVFLRHDLERPPVLEHAVLVDARLVQKGVATDDGLVRGNLVACDVGDHAACVGELAGLDADIGPVEVRARGERHYNLLQRGVPGSLSDAVDGHLNLAGPDLDPCERVGDGHPEVVMAVD